MISEDDVPQAARHAYHVQRQNAKRRGIPFRFTMIQWWAWWLEDDRWERRGMGADRLVMARINDAGAYEPGNVRCITHLENLAERNAATQGNHQRRSWGEDPTRRSHLEVRGDGHPRSRAVVTPLGRFGSAALAAEAHRITRQHAARLARLGKDGWRYE